MFHGFTLSRFRIGFTLTVSGSVLELPVKPTSMDLMLCAGKIKRRSEKKSVEVFSLFAYTPP